MNKFVFGAACAVLTVPMYAAAIFNTGNVPQTNESNVLLNMNQSASMVTGVTQQNAVTVDFSSTTDTLVTTANGQANVTAADGLINDVTISLASGASFGDLIINPSVGPTTNSGTTTVTARMSDGTSDVFTYSGGLSKGQNFVTILAGGSSMISSVTISSTGGFDSLKQVRISGVPGVTFVPEPGSLALLSGGLLLIPFLKRRKRV